jgi:hypothetical protein
MIEKRYFSMFDAWWICTTRQVFEEVVCAFALQRQRASMASGILQDDFDEVV